MAYSVTQLINEYNSNDAILLSNAVIKRHGLLNVGTFYLANKQLAHTYTSYATLPTAGIKQLGDGVATSTVSGSTATLTLTQFNANGTWDLNFVGTDYDSHYNRHAPLYFNSVADLVLKAIIYGTNANFGNASYTGTGLHQYITANKTLQEVKNFQITASATACTSIFAVRFSPFEDMDGAAIVVDPLTGGSLFYVNQDWYIPTRIEGSTGPYNGYFMNFGMNGALLLPGTNNAAAIRGIQTNSTVTTTMMSDMLDAVRADGNTFIFVNTRGKSILQGLKAGDLMMDPNMTNYDTRVYYYDGIPVIVTDTIVNTETGALYGLT